MKLEGHTSPLFKSTCTSEDYRTKESSMALPGDVVEHGRMKGFRVYHLDQFANQRVADEVEALTARLGRSHWFYVSRSEFLAAFGDTKGSALAEAARLYRQSTTTLYDPLAGQESPLPEDSEWYASLEKRHAQLALLDR